MLFSALSCGPKAPRLQEGDLLFELSGNGAMSGAIADATGRGEGLDFSHVAIVAGPQADSVIEASTEGGVRIVPLEEFIARAPRIGNRPGVRAMRLRDTTGVAAAVARARTFLGAPYDYSFRPRNGRIYCSELVWESFLGADGAPLFPTRPMNFRAADGTLPAFWSELFERLGEPVPEGVPGTNPNDMARDPHLEETGWF